MAGQIFDAMRWLFCKSAMKHAQEFENPLYFDMMTGEEQNEYKELQRNVGSHAHRYCRNKRLVTLQEQFKAIKPFCIRGNQRDSLRCLVCGICWLPDNIIAINTRQLRVLIAKSKSSINGSLARMKYEPVASREPETQMLLDAIPFLKGHYLELRQWTVRRPQNGDCSNQICTNNDSFDWDFDACTHLSTFDESVTDFGWDMSIGVCAI